MTFCLETVHIVHGYFTLWKDNSKPAKVYELQLQLKQLQQLQAPSNSNSDFDAKLPKVGAMRVWSDTGPTGPVPRNGQAWVIS